MKQKNISLTISKKCEGFTLIELLCTITVIGVLAAIMVPAISAALEKAKISGSASNLRQISIAANLYSAENGDRFVPHAIFDLELGENREWCFGYWQLNATNAFKEGILGPYMSNHLRTLTCPAWQTTNEQAISMLKQVGKPSLLGYGYNGLNLSQLIPTSESPGNQGGHYEGFARASNKKPQSTVMFATSAQAFGDGAGPQEMIWGPDHIIKSNCVRLVNASEAIVAWADGSVSMANAIPRETVGNVTLGELDINRDGTPDVDIWHR